MTFPAHGAPARFIRVDDRRVDVVFSGASDVKWWRWLFTPRVDVTVRVRYSPLLDRWFFDATGVEMVHASRIVWSGVHEALGLRGGR